MKLLFVTEAMQNLIKYLSTVFLLFSFNAFALFDECLDYFPNKQVPVTTQKGRDLCFDSFAVFYSPDTKKPIYTIEKLSRERLQKKASRENSRFYEEARLRKSERATLADYKGSGYDRGHNAPAGDMPNPTAMAQSFSLANVMPQAHENNRGIWAKSVEQATRHYVQRTNSDVFVFTGSTGNAGTIGKNKVVIPTHLFKLVYDQSKNRAWAYWIDNTNEAKMSPPILYKELVKRTGIDFKLSDLSQ